MQDGPHYHCSAKLDCHKRRDLHLAETQLLYVYCRNAVTKLSNSLSVVTSAVLFIEHATLNDSMHIT